MRAMRAAASALALLALAALAILVPPASEAAGGTTVVLRITTSQPAAVGSEVTFRATVSPASAAGSVAFTIDERALATVPVAGGVATTAVRIQQAGQYLVRAAFTPAAGSSGAQAASSGNVVLVVGQVARVSVQDSAGRSVPAGTAVAAGSPIRLAVAGFPARTPVTFTIGAATLQGSLTTDAKGAGVFSTRVPGLEKGEFLVVAYGGRSSAVAPILVEGIVPGATPTPTFCPTSAPPTDSASPTPTPTKTKTPTPTTTSPRPSTSSARPTKTTRPPTEGGKPTSSRSSSTSRGEGDGDESSGSTGDDDGLPGTGGNLPGTGAAVVSLLVLAGVAVAFGTGLISIGRRRPAGRHSR